MAIQFQPLSAGSGVVKIERKGTGIQTVPNIGMVSNIAFNTDLTPEEVDNIIADANLTYVDYNGLPAYPIFVNQDGSVLIGIINYGSVLGAGADVKAFVILATNGETTFFIYCSPIIAGFAELEAGWNQETIEMFGGNSIPLNMEASSTFMGLDIGTQNDAIKDIVYCGGIEPYYKELSGIYEPVNVTIKGNTEIDLTTLFMDEQKMPIKVITKVKPKLQSKSVTPNTYEQIVTFDNSYEGLDKVTIKEVTSAIDPNIKPENIVEGKSILGVNGTYKYLIHNSSRLSNVPAYCYSGINIFKSFKFFTLDEETGVYNDVYIDDYAFFKCAELKTLEFWGVLKSVGSCAFVADRVVHYDTTEDLYPIVLDKLTLEYDISKWFEVAFAEDAYLCSKSVIANNEEIASIHIPDSITELQPWVCGGWLMGSVNEVYLPNGLTKIGADAFYVPYAFSPSEDKKVYIDSLEHWMNIEFVNKNSNPAAAGLGNLYINNEKISNELVFDENVTKINPYTFANFKDLTSISGENVTNIGRGAFYNCYNIKNINFPNVTSIAPDAFYNSGTSTMKFSKLSGVFYLNGCKASTIDLDGNFSYLFLSTLENCGSLRTLVIRTKNKVRPSGSPDGMDAFIGTRFEYGSGTVYVTDEILTEYQEDPWWGDVWEKGNQLKPLSEYIE